MAGRLKRRGGEIVELLEERYGPLGRAVLPIRLREGGGDAFVEAETGSWGTPAVDRTLRNAAVLRGSEETALELFSADPDPGEVGSFLSRSPAALFQLDSLQENPARPAAFIERFKEAAGRHWGVELGYEAGTRR